MFARPHRAPTNTPPLGHIGQVRQMAHWLPQSPGFFEPLRQTKDLRLLTDGAWVVWSQRRAAGPDAIPDTLQGRAPAGLGLLGMSKERVRAAAPVDRPACVLRRY